MKAKKDRRRPSERRLDLPEVQEENPNKRERKGRERGVPSLSFQICRQRRARARRRLDRSSVFAWACGGAVFLFAKKRTRIAGTASVLRGAETFLRAERVAAGAVSALRARIFCLQSGTVARRERRAAAGCKALRGQICFARRGAAACRKRRAAADRKKPAAKAEKLAEKTAARGVFRPRETSAAGGILRNVPPAAAQTFDTVRAERYNIAKILIHSKIQWRYGL